MSDAVIEGADVTGSNLAHLPAGFAVLAGYSTGSEGIPWSEAQWAEHPDAIRIDQSPADTPAGETADVLDVEGGAATFADCAPWALAAQASYAKAARPGQRHPAIYASQDNLTPVCNALAAARVTGVGLVVADWNDTKDAAVAVLQASSGPYPVVGVQYADEGLYDLDVFLASWVNARSAKAAAKAAPAARAAMPPGQWDDPQAWTWAEATISGTGLDGKLHSFAYSKAGNAWAKVL
jgi:hypothetical protein